MAGMTTTAGRSCTHVKAVTWKVQSSRIVNTPDVTWSWRSRGALKPTDGWLELQAVPSSAKW